MRFIETALPGAFLIELERIEDERGFFARSWCTREAAARGIDLNWVQCNVSYNRHRGTLRGMHYQAPQWEAKLVRVTRGGILDIIVDLRPDSPTYKQHLAAELTEHNRTALLAPEGFAHGFVTLTDDAEIFYQMSEFYVPDQARGFRYDDPQFALPWPEGEKILSERDLALPTYTP